MSALLRIFYTLLLWSTQLELAMAMSAPNRNYRHIVALKADEDSYSKALMRLELNI